MFGLIVSDPACHVGQREALSARLHALDLPLTGFTQSPAAMFHPDMTRAAFLRTASAALLQPGQPLPAALLAKYLSGPDPLPANVLRKYLFLQFSLLPYLRPGRQVTVCEGFYSLGSDLLVVPVNADDTVDIRLPAGIWTELNGVCHEGRLRCMRGYQEMPVLVRENTLLPVSIDGQSLAQRAASDADRLTLHWFEPQEAALCTLEDGTFYQVRQQGEKISIQTNAVLPFHLIIHRNGQEVLIR